MAIHICASFCNHHDNGKTGHHTSYMEEEAGLSAVSHTQSSASSVMQVQVQEPLAESLPSLLPPESSPLQQLLKPRPRRPPQLLAKRGSSPGTGRGVCR